MSGGTEEIINDVDINEAISKLTLYSAKEHNEKFNPQHYLEGFYKTAKEDVAMQIVLFFLPGAGPTVYIPIVLRNRSRNIFTSDYAKINREELKKWIVNDKNSFDWSNVCNWIASIEAGCEKPQEMQDNARMKMRGVLEVNVFDDYPIKDIFYKVNDDVVLPKQFDLVTTIFCLEYATETLEDYEKAVKNTIGLIKIDGYLLQGGVLEATEYSFGETRFKCFYLKQHILIKALKENGMEIDEKTGNFKFIEHDGIFILISKKIK
ncbi:Methyltransferase, NNMT/PNMT/TEMT family and Putative NNMT/PNMT/TEMT methyltransferase, nematoda family-containing protein [Strongyloides ratti]|uniref:Methyltransferase, NNMT/PNMT/TEMT family and Putative NNMT/PNMT/TEMT methyltransferase, nematoda family-containing protein n=1 Tax=Strongyloides ratti TaxID=34506 RepID=A0A090L541_STRRB|nr:Methyltransferase, NNMT/PNMT/TEMT family and Putative NNMT/PNMT/TEMT methyltransferase, nematoda family-containing protein [Strongyloides ratti]CEF64842.1 Methyltransferase, NNMT/PNMT/TEMT family and Putative NNMT/PNMT/TEMT methyltransferase, nematoda family-containing protein [Strongyloides ratti]